MSYLKRTQSKTLDTVISACFVLGQSTSRLPQLQLYAHFIASVPKPPLPFPWYHPGTVQKKINSPCRVLDMNFLTCLHLSISVGFFQYCSRTAARQLDRNLTFHKLVAYMIAFHTGEDLRVLPCNFITKMY